MYGSPRCGAGGGRDWWLGGSECGVASLVHLMWLPCGCLCMTVCLFFMSSSVCLFVFVFFFGRPSVFLFVCIYIYLSTYIFISVCISIYQAIHRPSVYQSVSSSVCLSVFLLLLPIDLCNCLFILLFWLFCVFTFLWRSLFISNVRFRSCVSLPVLLVRWPPDRFLQRSSLLSSQK